MATGNFGAPPKPPNSASSLAARPRAASARAAASGRLDAVVSAASARAAVTASADSSAWARRVVHASRTAASTSRNAGIGGRASGGQYVPA